MSTTSANGSKKKASFEDNLAACRAYRENVRNSRENLRTFYLATNSETPPAAAAPVKTAASSGANIVNIERALTQYFAGLLGLTVDQDIFRGAVLPGKDGCAVRLNHLDMSSDEAIPAVLAQFECRSVNRDTVMERTSALAAKFPVYGINITVADGSTITARRISVISADISTNRADNGRIKTFGFISFKVQL